MGLIDLIPAVNHALDIRSTAIWLMRIAQEALRRWIFDRSARIRYREPLPRTKIPRPQLPEVLQPAKADVMKLYRSPL